jgi:ribA/ribD-fused uncharacterized protein
MPLFREPFAMVPITIRFYRTNEPYGMFSNFSRHPIRVDGETWPTAEHYFQAAKFSSSEDRAQVRATRSPFAAAQMGRERHRSFRGDWEQVRDEVMSKVLRAKFRQHEDLNAVLASTTGAHLVEHTDNDSYWADGGDGRGANRLGQLLEQVRSELNPGHAPMMPPVWMEFPDIEDGDMCFRMGAGEGYVIAHNYWYGALPEMARAEYDACFPAPAYWRRSLQSK